MTTTPNDAKYAGIYADENLIVTQFCDTEEGAWQEMIDNSGETRESIESAHYVQRFTQKEIDNLPEID